jgi:hypothetical protein
VSTISPPAGKLGEQAPQILHLPPDVHSLAAAEEAIELARAVGMTPDRSQELTLEAGLGERADGTWSAFEVADIEPRQNGKGDTIQIRELAGLFLFSERLLIHTAHEFPTANEAFLRMVAVIESNRDLGRQVLRIRFANGEQGIELRSGARLKYRARTGGAARGFAGADLVVYDEAFALTAEQVAASLPTLSTSPNAQVWYGSSAGLATSTQLWALRLRALRGDAGRLAYSEHTAERLELKGDGSFVSHPIDETSEANVALANPAYGYRISRDYVDAERAAMSGDDGKFGRERLGVWDPLPETAAAKPAKLPADKWAATVTDTPPVELIPGELALAFDVSRDGAWSTIAVASGTVRSSYVEVIEHAEGVGWLPARLVELVTKWNPTAVGCNSAGPAGAQVAAVLEAFADAEISSELLHLMNAQDYKSACGGFYSAVVEGTVRRLAGQPELEDAGASAAERPLGDAWAWDRRSETIPISPLVAVTIARALLPTEPERPGPVFAY